MLAFNFGVALRIWKTRSYIILSRKKIIHISILICNNRWHYSQHTISMVVLYLKIDWLFLNYVNMKLHEDFMFMYSVRRRVTCTKFWSWLLWYSCSFFTVASWKSLQTLNPRSIISPGSWPHFDIYVRLLPLCACACRCLSLKGFIRLNWLIGWYIYTHC